MSTVTVLMMVIVAMLLVIDVALYQIYWQDYAAEYGYVDYSAGTGYFIFWKMEISQ